MLILICVSLNGLSRVPDIMNQISVTIREANDIAFGDSKRQYANILNPNPNTSIKQLSLKNVKFISKTLKMVNITTFIDEVKRNVGKTIATYSSELWYSGKNQSIMDING